MGQFTVSVADEEFKLACKDGEETRLSGLAGRVDAKAKLLRNRLGSIDERRLLLMAAMLLTDELDEMREERDDARARLKQAAKARSGTPAPTAARQGKVPAGGAAPASPQSTGVPQAEVTRFVNAVCEELEQLAQTLEKT